MGNLFFFVLAAWLSISINCDPILGELYTSVEGLLNWTSVRNDLLTIIDDHLRVEKERLARLGDLGKILIESLNSDDKIVFPKPDEDNPTKIGKMAHPINAFITLNRITTVLDEIDALLEDDQGIDLKSQIEHLKAQGKLPTRDDFIGSGRALLRLQKFYNLTTDTLADGKLSVNDEKRHSMTPPHMSSDLFMDAIDCFELGKIAYANEDYPLSIEWFQIALELIEKEQNQSESSVSKRSNSSIRRYPDPDTIISDILDHLAFAAYKNERIEYAARLTRLWLNRNPKNERALYNLKYYQEILEDGTRSSDSIKTWASEDDSNSVQAKPNDRYEADVAFNTANYELLDDMVVRNLCTSNVETISKNKCTKTVKFGDYRLNPELKIEILHKNPDVIRILDILTENESLHLRTSAFPKLKRSTVQSQSGLTTTDFRIAKTAWLSRSTDPTVELIEKRISEVLGLNLSDSEDLQVVNYGLGGYYGPHLDAARGTSTESNNSQSISQLKMNDRLATILIYLNHVELGGATVFPRIGLTVRPVERSAVFWYNIQKDGLADEKTLHSGCPVLLGSKWIATIWPRERANSFPDS